jgi:hypothetical protein
MGFEERTMRRTMLKASCAFLLASALVPTATMAQQAKTSKERLSRKADDEQRIDNCRVPAALRGPTPRPGCPDEQAAAPAIR